MNEQQTLSKRWPDAISVVLILGLSLWILFISFNVNDPTPYLFPQLVSVALVALSVLALVRSLKGKETSGNSVTAGVIKNIAPGIAIMILFVFFAAEIFGFYTASALAFLAIVIIYDPASHSELRTWVKRFGAMFGFLAVMYGLFTLLLKVQIPEGLFI